MTDLSIPRYRIPMTQTNLNNLKIKYTVRGVSLNLIEELLMVLGTIVRRNWMKILNGTRNQIIGSVTLCLVCTFLLFACAGRDTRPDRISSDKSLAFDGLKMYLVTVSTQDLGSMEYVITGNTIVGIRRYTQFADSDWKRLLRAVENKETLELSKDFPIEKLHFKVNTSEVIEDFAQNQTVDELIKEYCPGGFSPIDEKGVYMVKLLIEAGIDVQFDEMHARFYIAHE